MLFKTLGIVLGFIRYRENSIIVRIYTEQFGLQSYIVNSVRTAQGKNTNRIALYQPLTILEMVVYKHKTKSINRISEVKIFYPYQSLPFEIKKTTMALFLAEIMGKTLKDEESQPELFEFLVQSLVFLDQQSTNYENFHLYFLFQLATHLGFSVQSAEIFEQETHFAGRAIAPEVTEQIRRFLTIDPHTFVQLNGQLRSQLLSHLLDFYALHIENFGTIRSLAVLREIF